MVSRVRKTLSLESLEDRALPSAASTYLVYNASGVATQRQVPAQAETLFVGGAAAIALQANGGVVAVGEAATLPAGASTSYPARTW